MWKKTRIGEFLFERKETFAPDDKTIAGLKKIEKIKFFNGEICLGKYKITNTKQIIVEPGDFVFSGLNIEKGAVSINLSNERLLVSTNYSTCGVDYKIINQDYLLRYINSSEFKELLIDNLKKDYGFTRPKHLLPLEIDLPNIKKQKEIVERIKSIETEDGELKTELTYQQTLIKKLRQQILQEAIEGKLTAEWRKSFSTPPRGRAAKQGGGKYEHASVLLERIIAEKNQMIKDKKIKPYKTIPPISDEDKPFPLPSGWVWCRLGEISINSLGKMLDAQKNKGKLKPYLRNMNVQWFNVNTTDLKKMPFEKHETEKYSAIKGDILICEGGYPGQAAIWNKKESIMFQKALHRVRFILRCFPSNLFVHFLWLWDKNGEIKKYFTGSGIKHLTGKQLNLMLIPLPPITEQNAIAERVEKLIALCDQLETKIAENKTHAEQLMRAVLKDAFAQKNE